MIEKILSPLDKKVVSAPASQWPPYRGHRRGRLARLNERSPRNQDGRLRHGRARQGGVWSNGRDRWTLASVSRGSYNPRGGTWADTGHLMAARSLMETHWAGRKGRLYFLSSTAPGPHSRPRPAAARPPTPALRSPTDRSNRRRHRTSCTGRTWISPTAARWPVSCGRTPAAADRALPERPASRHPA